MVFHGSLRNWKSLQVSWTILSILANLNNAVVCMVSFHSIYKSFSPCINPLGTILSMSFTFDITITFIFHSFFSFLARSTYLFLFSLSFSFPCGLLEQQSSQFSRFYFSYWLSLGLVIWMKLDDLFVPPNSKEFCTFHFLGQILDCAYIICSYDQI